MARGWATPLLWVVLALPAGCGAGTAGIASGGGGGGGSAPATTVSALEVDGRTSPASIRFRLTGQQVPAARLEVLLPDAARGTTGGPRPLVVPIPGPLVVGTPGQGGALNTFAWDYAASLGSGFQDGITFRVVLANGALAEVLSRLGNDAPQLIDADRDGFVDGEVPSGEVAGIAHLRFRVADSSGDAVDAQPEFAVVDGLSGLDPDTLDALDWRPATSVGAPLEGVPVQAAGTTVDFFWDVPSDLPSSSHSVLVRFLVDDGLQQAAPLAAPPFLVDNNATPTVTILEGALLASGDASRGVPIPLSLTDDDGDTVSLVVQWARPGQAFPELPDDLQELAALRDDPLARAAAQIADEWPTYVGGRVQPLGADRVRLPELGERAAGLLAFGLAGRSLEILRGHGDPRLASRDWQQSLLASPVDALPLGAGLEALVLEAPVPGSARLSRVELATGAVSTLVPQAAQGTPVAMDLDPARGFLVVAAAHAGAWRLLRVDIATGQASLLAQHSGSATPAAAPRDVLSLGWDASLLTVGDALVRVDHVPGQPPRSSLLLTGLVEPWGLARDPLSPRSVLLAERGGGPGTCGASACGRLRRFDLDSQLSAPIVVRRTGGAPAGLQSPRQLAVDEHGRLLVVVEPTPGHFALDVVELGGAGRNEALPAPVPLPGAPASLATGPAGLRLLALPALDDLAIGGGIQQRRALLGDDGQSPVHDALSGAVTVDGAFAPALRPGQPWRIDASAARVAVRSGQALPNFVWDSRQALAGDVVFRAQVYDDDSSLPFSTTIGKRVEFAAGTQALPVLGSGGAFGSVPADLDADGDLDVAMVLFDVIALVYQTAPREFSPPITVSAGSLDPLHIDVADLDLDGHVDLAVSGFHAVRLLRQQADGSFALAISLPAGFALPIATSPMVVRCLQTDPGSLPDLIALTPAALHLPGITSMRVFRQSAPGGFSWTDHTSAVFSTDFVSPTSAIVADLAGDARPDFAVSGTAFTASVDAAGQFQTTEYPLPAPGCSAWSTDIDRDGTNELAMARTDGKLALYDLAGGTPAQPLLERAFSPDPSTPGAGASLDLNGDGLPELVLVDHDGDRVVAFLGKPDGGYEELPVTLLETADVPDELHVQDMDGDRRLDLVTAAGVLPRAVHVAYQAQPGRFDGEPTTVGGPTNNPAPDGCALGDLDGDGDLDLLSLHQTTSTLRLHLQQLPGLFLTLPVALPLDAGAGPADAVLADLDGDGDLDLATANETASSLSVLSQVAPASFQASAQLVAVGMTNPRDLVAADFDGDGLRDLASANIGSDTLGLFFNSPAAPGGLGQAPPTVHAVGSQPSALVAADLDGDGDTDLATAHRGDGDLGLLLDPAVAGVRLLRVGSPLDAGSFELVVEDLDADGDLDLVASQRDSQNLSLFLQDADGAFDTDIRRLPVSTSPRTLDAADIDLDGDVDLACDLRGESRLAVFRQLSALRFEAQQTLGTDALTGSPRRVLLADIDGDGDCDLLSANPASNNLALFWGDH